MASISVESSFLSKLRASLELDLPYVEREHLEFMRTQLGLMPENVRPAAVLALFGEEVVGSGEFSLLMTRRTERVDHHKGQMAFPGGGSEPEDRNDATVTALRETEEEVGIAPAQVHVLGTLPDLITVTGFHITPVVGALRLPIAEVPLRVNDHEIAEAFWIPVRTLFAPTTYRQESRKLADQEFPIHIYQVGQYRIWGATGSMIRNLHDRIIAIDPTFG